MTEIVRDRARDLMGEAKLTGSVPEFDLGDILALSLEARRQVIDRPSGR